LLITVVRWMAKGDYLLAAASAIDALNCFEVYYLRLGNPPAVSVKITCCRKYFKVILLKSWMS